MKKTLKQTRRIAAILLSMCLVLAMMPAATFAGTGTQDLKVSADENGSFTYEDGKVKITSGGSYSISMAENVKTTTDSIEIGEGLGVYLSLYKVSIDLSSKGGEEESEDGKYVALKIGKNAKVTIDINSDNTLKSGSASAGIELAENAELTIRSFIGSASTLTVIGGGSGAGIGGPVGSKGGKVTIEDGTINATGGVIGGAGIDAKEVIINSGVVYATGGANGGAGIGGSFATRTGGSSENRDGGTVTINNGEVTAMGNGGGAGIGGAFFGNGGTVNINGGFVVARGGDGQYLGAAGIGSGNAYEVPETHPDYGKGNGGTVNINGGIVVAEGGKSGVGIGGSLKGANVTIKGGKVSVTATGGFYSDNTKRAAGIGVGPQGNDPGTLTIIPPERGFVVNAGAGVAAASAVEGSPFKAETEIISLVKDKPYFNCRQGQFTVIGGQEGRDYIFVDDVLNIKSGGTYTVGMVSNIPVTSDRIEVNASEAVKLIFDNVNINCSSGTDIAAVEINGPEKVTLELRGKNKLNSGSGSAGIELKNNANLVITSSSGGQLDTHGGYFGAGIGGINNTAMEGVERSDNKVVIAGGIINATGGSGGAGIGGNMGCDGCDVTVTGGVLTATGKGGAAGIGGGIGGNGGSFTITGGKANAVGSTEAAGIGGGLFDGYSYIGGKGGTVVIKGGELTAIGKSCAIGAGAYLGAGMGEAKTSGTITISPAGAGINAWAGSSETENKVLEGSTFFTSTDITDLIKDKTYFYSREYVPYVPPAEDDVKTTTDGTTSETTTSTTIKDTKTETVKNEQGEDISKVTATVSEKVAEKLVDAAVSNKSDTVEITVKSNDGNKVDSEKQTEIEIPKKALESIAKDTEADLVIKTDNGQVILDNKTLETIAAAAEGDTVKITVNENTQLKEEQKPALDIIGDRGHIFDIAAIIGDKRIHDFRGGKAHVTLPMPEKLKGKDVVIIYINDKGICEILNHTMETMGAEEYIKFTTSHFSNFAVVEKADAEKIIEKQNADKINSLIKEAKLKATTSKTSKKNVKIKVSVKNNSSLIKEAKAMGYTVKYKYYRSTSKASKYKAVKTKTSNSYINTTGKKGTKYYYKAKVMVYDGKTLVAQTELKQCSYGVRTWSR